MINIYAVCGAATEYDYYKEFIDPRDRLNVLVANGLRAINRLIGESPYDQI